MNHEHAYSRYINLPTLSRLPLPAKALMTMIILTIAIAMLGALGQIIVHDIIPTFYAGAHSDSSEDSQAASVYEENEDDEAVRGDLFADASNAQTTEETPSFYKTEQFVWTLKWTHIHLFGMNMIFIFVGVITVLLNVGNRWRTWLVVLSFVGVLIDIAAMWLKAYISPAFFWLHVPGGGLFGFIFAFVSLRAMWEMWRPAFAE